MVRFKYNNKLIAILILSFAAAIFAPFSHAKTYIVGAQNIDYYPYYNFASEHEKGLGWAVLEAFAKHSGHEFVYLSMPVERLQIELKKGNVDFVFPDNPRWNAKDRAKVYSRSIVDSFAVTLVKRVSLEEQNQRIQKLAIPLGFTPAKWQSQIKSGQLNVIGVKSIFEGLSLLQQNTVDAMDVEYNVARRYELDSPQLGPFTADLTLPHNSVEFSLSTLHYNNVIEQLDAFLKDNSEAVSLLKQQYGITNNTLLIQSLMSRQQLTSQTVWSPL